MKVKENDHLPLAWLEECIFNVVVQDVHLVSSDTCVSVGSKLGFSVEQLLISCHVLNYKNLLAYWFDCEGNKQIHKNHMPTWTDNLFEGMKLLSDWGVRNSFCSNCSKDKVCHPRVCIENFA